ncbi:Protein translocase subunit SecA [Macleaya cordata]|uniref:Protein translocase subunit SecA n=1 Tax=Macleaya cordata TaxID=56857 RepID=A0A200Q5C1_MACCD|nr:Protein translocase subunit SecA [Macleaya cordata]
MELELPECPVCLQVYNNEEEEVVPRVLSCGHSACESCLTRIPQRFPNTIRCPACTQLVHFPPHPQGPSALPKNIDLLSFISQYRHQQNPNPNPDNHTSSHSKKHPRKKQHDFLPAGLLWSDENEKELFYSNWKDWILPMDLLSIQHQDFLFASVYQARIIHPPKRSSSSSCFSLRANQMVGLLHIASSSSLNHNNNDGTKVIFNLSYTARVMEALNRLREEERAELSLILGASSSSSSTQFRVCKAYGLWMNSDDGSLFLVCQRFNAHLPNKLLSGGLRNSVIGGGNNDDDDGLVEDVGETTPNPEINKRMSGFTLVGMDLCEALIGLHSEGLVCGCLALTCFTFDYFGRVFIDPNEVLVIGRRVRKCIAEIAAAACCSGTRSDDTCEETDASFSSSSLLPLKNTQAFVSPELLFRLFHSKGVSVPDCDSLGYSVGYGSDVWSLACILVLLLVGDSFIEDLFLVLYHLPPKSNNGNCDELLGLYRGWVERVGNVLGSLLATEFAPLHQVLCRCLDFDPGTRPHVTDVLRCIRELIIRPHVDILVSLDAIDAENDTVHCLTLGDLCDPRKEIGGKSEGSGADFGQVREGTCERDAVEGLCLGELRSIDLQGHLDCITGFAVGGDFLFSSSFDKTVHVWSLQNFSHVQSLRGHEHRVMAVVFVDAEKPLCISGDSGGGIFVWGIGIPIGQEPLKKWFELKDWRYSGIHAMEVSGTDHLYTGSGDKSIKAWSLQDYTLTCTMNGHKSVVSSLAVCDGVLYSGSWDGTIRLWSLNNHSPLAVLGDDTPGNVASVLSLSVEHHMLVAAYESGCVKIWRNDALSRSMQTDGGASLALDMDGKWLFMGGWNKTVSVQEISEDDLHVDARPIGSIACDSVVTALLYWEGKLYVGFADRVVKDSFGNLKKNWSDFTSLNYWVVRDYYRLVDSVNSLELQIQSLSNEQLAAKTEEFRLRLGHGETLAHIQSEAFAVVREAAKRKLGMRHFDVQIIGGAVLHDGSIAEMKTGEGKTLVSTLAAYLNALTGEGVHVVTVNDYLAQRDAEWMGRVHRFLGLSVGLIQRGMTAEERRSNYNCDITYTNNSELGFDYLRDNLAGSSGQLVMRWPKPFHFAIVDEVDSVLIDEGRNPLLISGEASKDAARYPVAAKVAELLVRGLHYNVELKDNSVELTEEGIALAEMSLETNDLWDENDPWARFVMNALKAKEFYRRDVQYIVRNGKALIINELTGRVEEKRRWSEGIHQSVEAKEGLKIQADSVVVAQITYQSLFKLYPKLSGMTGTAKTEDKEFLKMFQMPVIEVPTNLPNIRKDLPIQAFATAHGKWENVREEVEYMFDQGRPVLVGTTSVENSEYLSDLLKERNIPHNVLNARPKYAAREAEIVAQAGRKYAITISTNMAGRGTDIILGGNPKMLAREVIEDSLLSFLTQEAPNVEIDGEPISQQGLSKIKVGPSSLALLAKTALMAKYVHKSEGKSWTYQEAKSMISESIQLSQSTGMQELEKLLAEESEMYPLSPTIAYAYLSVLKDSEEHSFTEGSEVKRLGGLHVIGTSLHESRRIDNQLRGRAGRQGDPGSTRFMVSLQDEMFQKFNFDTEWAVKLISKITNNEDIPIEGDAIVKQLLGLQINAEKYFFGIRKSLVEFDEVLEVQRKHVYDLRQSILTGDSESCSHHIFQYMQAVVDEIVFGNTNPHKHPSSWSLGKLLNEFTGIAGKIFADSFAGITEEALLASLEQPYDLKSVKIDNLSFLNMPTPPNAFRGIRRKSSSLKRWVVVCTDESTRNGRYQGTANLLRKYLGDFLIGSYLDVIQESGYDDAYIKEIERAVLVKTLDCFWRDHLINMNRLSSAVNVRSFGHRNPLEEYKIDGCRFFISMLSAIRRLTVESLLLYWASPVESDEELFISY